MLKPWLLFSLLNLATLVSNAPQAQGPTRRTLFAEPVRDVPGSEKEWTGFRVERDSNRMVYHHEQTIAVVELGPNRELINCELLEVKTAKDRRATLDKLKPISNMRRIAFGHMMDLMHQCHKMPTPQNFMPNALAAQSTVSLPSFTSLFQGIIPGTKWCGTGDLADTYFDLGPEQTVDRCCRTHDMCPVKVAAMRTQYNITNYSMATSSHCSCDKAFYDCLKAAETPLSDLIGSVYFNIGNLKCVDARSGRSASPKLHLTKNSLHYQRT